MNNKIKEIIDTLKRIEEKVCIAGFGADDARQHTKLIKELKLECDVYNIDCRELVKCLPLAEMDYTSLAINT